jgi:transcriptional adapter 3
LANNVKQQSKEPTPRETLPPPAAKKSSKKIQPKKAGKPSAASLITSQLIDDFDGAIQSGQLRQMTVLGGIPVDGDYSKLPRASNQTPIDQFWRFCDQFFKNISDEDLRWLDNRGDEFTPFLIPQLGRHYTTVWDEEARGIVGRNVKALGTVPTGDADVETANVTPSVPELEPLAQRILSALMHDDLMDTNMIESEEEPEEAPRGKHPTMKPASQSLESTQVKTKEEMLEIEDRVKNELLGLGLAAPEDIDSLHQTVSEQAQRAMDSSSSGYFHPGDDEVSKELLRLQDQLRSQIEVVARLKGMVKKYAVAWAAWQEWWNVKDMIEKWIEEFYNKKFVCLASNN